MVKLPRRREPVSAEILMRLIWVSSFLAMIFALPTLAIFLGIYWGTGNLPVAAAIGFGAHFVTLAFAGRISRTLTGWLS